MYEKMIAITNRKLCPPEDYLNRIGFIASLHPRAIVLREKNLSSEEYLSLASKVIPICEKYKTPLILHGFADAALELSHPYIHMPLNELCEFSRKNGSKLSSLFKKTGTSVHSAEDAKIARELGADYLFAGNIWEAECKPGLCGRGLDFLREIVLSADIPVYAIGGVTPEKMPCILKTGAAGACMMSGFMQMNSI